MRFVSWLITLPIVIVAVVFALHNRDAVMLNFWPFDMQVQMPLSFLVLASLFTGFALGASLMGMSNIRLRMQKFGLERKASKLAKAAAKPKETSKAAPAETVMHKGRLQIISNIDERNMP